MKHIKNSNKQSGILQLQEVHSQPEKFDNQTLSDLELILTNSAFGYEYALTALDQGNGFDIESEKVLKEVNDYRQVYFDARNKLKNLDSKRLSQVEADLKIQKLLVFSKQNYLH